MKVCYRLIVSRSNGRMPFPDLNGPLRWKKAEHWNEYYEVLHMTAFTPHVLYKHCKAVMLHPNRNGDKSTFNMQCHLDKCEVYSRYMCQQPGELANTGNLHTCVGWMNPRHRVLMTSERLQEKLLRIIISANQPFSLVDNEEFHDLLDEAFPSCNIPRYQIIPDHLSNNTSCAVSELVQELAAHDSKVTLTLDVWTTRTNFAFLGTFLS